MKANNIIKFKKKIKFITVLLLATVLITYQPAFSRPQTIKKNEIQSLIKIFDKKKLGNFDSFLKQILPITDNLDLIKTIISFKENKISSEIEWINVYRLLGIYSRIKYKDELFKVLGELVAIQTDKKEGLPQYENPGIIKFGEAIKKLAKEYGLEFKNIDNRIFEVNLKGNTSDSFGVYTHADVVPADKSKWVLDNGTKLEPYKLSIIGNNLYGRGTEDDKCSIVTSMMAMRIIKENGFKLKRAIKLIIETTEETSGEGINYYKKRYKVPDYNIVLDSAYPVITAEKGFGVIAALYRVMAGTGTGPEILDITGGLAYNQIPSTSTATIYSDYPEETERVIKEMIPLYKKQKGNNFKLETNINEKNIIVKVTGRSAHSSAPQNGINPVSLLFNFLFKVNQRINFKNNHFKKAINFIYDNFGLDYYGKKLGIDYKDSFMGPLTASLTFINLKNGELEVALNIRAPRGKEPLQLKTEIEKKLKFYRQKSGNDFTLEVRTGNYMFRNPKGAWINTLLNVFGEVTGQAAKPKSSAGGTTAKQLPNGVSFGPAMPNEVYTGHTDNEFKKINNYLFDMQMFTEMFLRIGNLPKMQ
jgi:predicted dipeptidase